MPPHADLDLEDVHTNELQYGAVCNLYGDRRDFTSLRAGLYTADFRYLDEADAEEESLEHDPHANDPDVRRLWVLTLRLLTLLVYKRSGRFTDKQLRVMYFTWIRGLSLREIAKLEEIDYAESIRQRIVGTKGYGGLKKKAPEFWKWWEMTLKRG